MGAALSSGRSRGARYPPNRVLRLPIPISRTISAPAIIAAKGGSGAHPSFDHTSDRNDPRCRPRTGSDLRPALPSLHEAIQRGTGRRRRMDRLQLCIHGAVWGFGVRTPSNVRGKSVFRPGRHEAAPPPLPARSLGILEHFLSKLHRGPPATDSFHHDALTVSPRMICEGSGRLPTLQSPKQIRSYRHEAAEPRHPLYGRDQG